MDVTPFEASPVPAAPTGNEQAGTGRSKQNAAARPECYSRIPVFGGNIGVSGRFAGLQVTLLQVTTGHTLHANHESLGLHFEGFGLNV